jgi:uncharacterized delta-60 repeat protein
MANLEVHKNSAAPTAKICAVRIIPYLSLFIGAILGLTNLEALSASPLETWVHRHGNILTNSLDAASKAILDSRGDLIVIGTTSEFSTGNDIITLRYSGATGTLLWQSRYDGPAQNNDVPAGVAVDSEGNVLVTGASSDALGYPEGVALKYRATSGALLWEKRLAGAAETRHELAAVAVDENDNVLVTGYSVRAIYPDIYTAKYSASGEVLWEKLYDSPDESWDEARSIAVDAAGDVVVAGLSTESDGYQDFYSAKYAGANGGLLWQRRYQGQAHGHHSFYAVAIDSNGDVVAAGSTSSTEGGAYAQGFYTVKFSGLDGATRWDKTATGPANAGGVALALAVDANNDVVTTGALWDSSVSDAYTAKYASSDGRLLWERSYDGAVNKEDRAHAVAIAPNGDVLVSGYSDRSGITGSDYFTARYAANDGRMLWKRHYNGPSSGEDQATAVAVDRNGRVFVTGFANDVLFRTDCYTVKYDGFDGSTLWETTYRGTAQSDEWQPTVALDESGNVLLAGLSGYESVTGHYAAKYAAATGTLLWETRFDAGTFEQALAVTAHRGAVAFAGFSWALADHYVARVTGHDGVLLWHRHYPGTVFTASMTMDSQGNVLVAGGLVPGFAYTNFYLAKHAAADGRLLWEKRSEPISGQEQFVAVAVDGHGDVAVTGPSRNDNFAFDYYTAKYAGESGALLWERRHSGNNAPNNQPTAIAADAEGNVVVTGASGNGYLTLKYSAAGALLWEQRYIGPVQGPDVPRAIAVAANGDVIVTGSSTGSEHNPDYYTVRYAATQGAVRWAKRHNGPANREDVAVAVAVDLNDSVVVTGYSFNEINTTDYLTMKYDGSNGDLLWEKRYNGPADGEDFLSTGQSLALGPAGVVVVAGISDSRPGDPVERDFATVRYTEPPGIKRLLDRAGYEVQFFSVPGRTYAVQRAETLTGPWTTLTMVTAPTTGLIVYDDLDPLPVGAFYRLRTP